MANKTLEKRFLKSSSLETREEDGKKHISGIIPYDKNSEDLGGFTEIIRKGAFTKTLQEGDARCLWAHNMQYVLGRVSAKSLVFEDKDDGLHFDCLIPNTSWANDVFETISRRDAPGVSFGFYIIKDSWNSKSKLRELLEVNLLEVSVGVAFPAYPDSDSNADVRSLFESKDIRLEELKELFLRTNKNDYKLTENDAQIVTRTIDALKRLLPEAGDNEKSKDKEPSDDTLLKPSDIDTFNARNNELAILEAENKIIGEF